jgi:protein involved in polysaccharide export with SLBB domain
MLKLRAIALLGVIASVSALGLTEEPPKPSQGSSLVTPVGTTSSAAPVGTVLGPQDPAIQEIMDAVRGMGSKLKAPVLQTVPGSRYRVAAFDEITVNFTYLNAFDEIAFVKPDGYLSLIGAPDIYVFGDTQPEILEKVKKSYEGVVAQPILVDVVISLANPPYFVVGGQVNNPGKFVLHGQFTVMEAIAAAGGFNLGTAKHSHVLLFHRVSKDLVATRLVNLKRIQDKGDLGDDVFLQNGDLVYVPKNFLSKVTPFLQYTMMYSAFIDVGWGASYRFQVGSD